MGGDQEVMKRVTVDIPEEVWLAAAAFVPEVGTPEERLPALVAAAFEEWVRWMEGSFRPTSISELETRRVHELYEHLFVEEIPSADHLGGLLLLPMGRARYLMQALAYRYGQMLKERREEHIRRALEASEVDDQGRPFVVIDPGCRDIFERTARALRAQNKIESGLEGEVVLDGVRYGMGEGHLKALKDASAEYRRFAKSDRERYSEDPELARFWALSVVEGAVNRKVENDVYPILLGEPGSYKEGWGFKSLLGAMWLQMRNIMVGDVNRCPACGQIFHKSRRDKTYCSDRCSGRARAARAYRRKVRVNVQGGAHP